MVFIIRAISARPTVGVLLQLGPEQAFPVGHDVLGEVEQGGFLAWRLSGSCPSRLPNLSVGPFVLDQFRSRPVCHAGPAHG